MLYSTFDTYWTVKASAPTKVKVRTIYDVYYNCYPGAFEGRYEVTEKTKDRPDTYYQDYSDGGIDCESFKRYYKTKDELIEKERQYVQEHLKQLSQELGELRSLQAAIASDVSQL